MAKTTVSAAVLGSRSSATMLGTYQTLGSPLPEACFFLRIVNNTDEDVIISYDGINDNEIVLQNGGVFELGSQTNSQPHAQVALWRKSMQVYARGTAGTGTVYLSAYYV